MNVQLVVFVYADVAIATGEHLHDARQRALADEPRQRRRRRRMRVGHGTTSGARRVASAGDVGSVSFIVHLALRCRPHVTTRLDTAAVCYMNASGAVTRRSDTDQPTDA